MKNTFYYIFAFFLFIVMSCQKDVITNENSSQFDPPDIVVQNTSLVVYVGDQWDILPDAELSINGVTAMTNDIGRAFIPLSRINKTGDLLTITRKDRITLTKRIFLKEGEKNIMSVHMERSSKKYNYESSEPIELTTSNFVLNVPAFAFKNKGDNQDYTGQIDLEFRGLDGDDPILNQKMPGSLLSQDSEGIVRALNPFGMGYFEFFGDDGQPLQLRDNVKATISFMLSSDLLSEAIDGTPIFYLDEDTGYWKEQGIANLVGNTLVAEVSHFSWWACHLYMCIDQIVTVSGRVISEEGTPCGGCQIELIGDGGSRHMVTSSEGTFTTLACPRETYEVVLSHSHINCGEEDDYSFGFFYAEAVDTDWGDMIINDPNLVTVSGQVLPCEGDEAEEGAYIIVNDEIIVETFDNGLFSFSACVDEDNPIEITGYNTIGTLQSNMEDIIVTSSGASDINLTTCDESDVYLKVWRDGELVAYVGQVVQEKICHEDKMICIAVQQQFFQKEYFSAVIEFTSELTLNAIGEYFEATASTASTILYQEDINVGNGGLQGRADFFDEVKVLEFDEYKKVYLKFSTLVGLPPGLELNYEVEFRIKI